MPTTTTAESETATSMAAIRRAVLALVALVAVVASGVPLAGSASAAPVRAREECVNIVTCRPGQLPEGKVDRGRPGGPPLLIHLPEPAVVFADHDVHRDGRSLQRLEITNWNAYAPALFRPAAHLPACGTDPNATRLSAEILNASTGGRLRRLCAIDAPEGLREAVFTVTPGAIPPPAVVVRLTDRQTGRVATSDPVAIPPVSHVVTSYTRAEHSNLVAAAEHWGVQRCVLQKSGVMATRFIHGVAGTTGTAPLRPRPATEGPIGCASSWTPDDRHALEWVSDYYDLTYAEAQKLGAAVMVFFAALDH